MKVAVGVVIGLLIAAALAWNGAEMHYRSCVDAAEARTPLTRADGGGWGSAAGDDPLGVLGAEERQAAVDGCSRLPW
jgi:hypothetical protein